jgi:hypothetical protein
MVTGKPSALGAAASPASSSPDAAARTCEDQGGEGDREETLHRDAPPQAARTARTAAIRTMEDLRTPGVKHP